MTLPEPYYADDTQGVHFQVRVGEYIVQAHVSGRLLARTWGEPEQPGDWLSVWHAHRGVLEAAVVRRVHDRSRETVVLQARDLMSAPDRRP